MNKTDKGSNRSQIDFGLAVSILLGSLWYYGFDVLRVMDGVKSVIEPHFSLALVHGYIFLLFATSLFLLFDQADFSQRLLPTHFYLIFHWVWPLIIMFLFILITLISLTHALSDRYIEILFIVLIVFGLFSVLYLLEKFKEINVSYIWFGVILFASLLLSTLHYIIYWQVWFFLE